EIFGVNDLDEPKQYEEQHLIRHMTVLRGNREKEDVMVIVVVVMVMVAVVIALRKGRKMCNNDDDDAEIWKVIDIGDHRNHKFHPKHKSAGYLVFGPRREFVPPWFDRVDESSTLINIQ
ncbi:hypothetical protein HN51_044705, partial [Arachis hypogaea]